MADSGLPERALARSSRARRSRAVSSVQAGAQVGVVIGAVEGLLEAPVQFQLRRGAAFQVLELREGDLHGGVRQQRTAPVALQREQSLREGVRHIGADEVAAVIAQHLGHVDLRIPAERAPDGLVDIVVAAFGIGQEAGVGEGLQHAEDLRVIERPRVDAFALLGLGVGDVPIVHGELRVHGVGDVGVEADGVSLGDALAQFGQVDADLRAEDDAAEPWRLLVHQPEELLHPGRVEALRRDPHRGLGVILAQVGGLLFEQGHQVARLGVSGVAAGDEDGVDAGKLAEDFAPFAERRLHGGGVRVVGIHGRIPDPAFEAVLLGEARHLDHHLHGREGKVRAIGGIVGAGRNQLDGVGAEDGEVADVAFPHRDAPGVVGVGLGAVAQLMAAQRVFRRGLNIERAGKGDRIAAHFEGAQQAADAEEDAALVVADDLDAGRAAVVEGAQAIAFGGQGSAGRGALDGDDRLGRRRDSRRPTAR